MTDATAIHNAEQQKQEIVPAQRWTPPSEAAPQSYVSESRAILATIERIALDPSISLEKMDRILAMQERIMERQARMAFSAAIADAKAEIPVIAKNKHVGFESKKEGAAKTDYWHEDFAEVARTVDPILGKHGLSYRFRTIGKPGEPVTVTCIIAHREGHEEENSLTAPHDASGNKNPIQAIGSTLTYLQRYSLKAALGLAAGNDDDGVASSAETSKVSVEQAAALAERIEKNVINLDKFLAVFKIAALADLPAKRFADAMTEIDLLLAYRAKKAKEHQS
jgi:hypothetical protein